MRARNCCAPDLRGDRADLLVDDDALRIDEEALRRAIHAPVDRDSTVVIVADLLVGIAELRAASCTASASLSFQSMPTMGTRPCCLIMQQRRVLVATAHAPGAPDIDQDQ